MDDNKKLHVFAKEKFKELKLEDGLQFRYAISNFGRLVSFTKSIKHGRIVNGSNTEGYRLFRYKLFHGKQISYRHKFFSKLVAENFLERTSDEQTYVLHLDHNLSNDLVGNLKWATKQEMLDHQRTNPKVLKARKISAKRLVEYVKKRDEYKLNTSQVILIKKLLADPNRNIQMKRIASRFGISTMQLYRIKTGENWGHVTIDSQDEAPKTDKPTAKKVAKNEKPLTEKKVDLTQKSLRELEKLKIEEAWNEKLEAFRNGEKSELIQRWIDYNRRQYRKGRMPTERFEKLVEVNFPFETAPIIKVTSNWDKHLEEWKKGNRKSGMIMQWKNNNVRRFVKGKLSGDKIAKLKEVGILK